MRRTQPSQPLRKETEHRVRTYVRDSDHKRVVLYSDRNDIRLIDTYRMLIRAFLDHDGHVKPEADKTSVTLSLKTFRLLIEKANKLRTNPDTLVSELLVSSKELGRGRLF